MNNNVFNILPPDYKRDKSGSFSPFETTRGRVELKTRFRKRNIMKTNKTLKKMKRMNCNPNTRGKTVNNETCYTSKALSKIKNSYNKNNPSTKILSSKPNVIINQLRLKLSQCEKEDCWLEQLSNREKTYMDKHIFAPDQPREWKSNPREWLSNHDILDVLKQYQDTYSNFKFIGPTPIDFDYIIPEEDGKCVWQELCKFSLQKYMNDGVNKIGVIFNLDKHNQSGSHWVSLFVDTEEGYIFYFDSAANNVPKEIKSLTDLILTQSKSLNKKLNYYTNVPNQHQHGDTECGMYSLYFIITMLDNKNMTTKQKINLFKNGKITDKYVESFRNKYFNT